MSRQVEIQLTLDNAAFDDDPGPEVARILAVLGQEIMGRGLEGAPERLRDINGNQVGWFTYFGDDDESI